MRYTICVILTSLLWIVGYLTWQFYQPPDLPDPAIQFTTHRFTFTVSGITGSVAGSITYNLR